MFLGDASCITSFWSFPQKASCKKNDANTQKGAEAKRKRDNIYRLEQIKQNL